MIRHADLPTLRAALWTLRAARQARRSLAVEGINGVHISPPPPLPRRAARGVGGMLRRMNATCLIRAAVVQAWDSAHGHPRDLVVGVTAPGEGFRAHAWLEGDPPCHSEGFAELLRRPPERRPTAAT